MVRLTILNCSKRRSSFKFTLLPTNLLDASKSVGTSTFSDRGNRWMTFVDKICLLLVRCLRNLSSPQRCVSKSSHLWKKCHVGRNVLPGPICTEQSNVCRIERRSHSHRHQLRPLAHAFRVCCNGCQRTRPHPYIALAQGKVRSRDCSTTPVKQWKAINVLLAFERQLHAGEAVAGLH